MQLPDKYQLREKVALTKANRLVSDPLVTWILGTNGHN